MGKFGQSDKEYDKNYSRVKDIISKAEGDKDKEIILAERMANLIKDEAKAINRAHAAKQLGYEHLFEIFFRRAYNLGSVSTLDYREYVLSKLLDE